MRPTEPTRPSDDGPDFDMIVNPSWGPDTSPKVEEILETIYSRVYYSFQCSERVQSLSQDEIEALAHVRLNAHEHLDKDEHAELRAFEQSLNDMLPTDEYHENLLAEWAHVILDAVDIKTIAADGGA